MDLEALAAAGLYDPGSPDADERRELLAFLADQGCTIEEMQAAHARGRLFALAGDRIIRPDRDRFSLDDVAAQLDAPVDDVRSAWRALGLVDVGVDAPVASPADVEMLRVIFELAAVFGLGPALGIARVFGGALSRAGDAVGTLVRSRLPDMSVASSGSELATGKAFAQVAAFAPRMGAAIDTLFRHHLESARMHFERSESWDLQEAGGIRVGVGFADLCGFTGLTEQLSMDGLSQLLTRFEEIASDVVHDHGARLVKFLGDAVMYVATDAVTAVAVAESLLDAAAERGMTARAGVTVGSVLSLDGDYFGPVVNLAARLVALADPGSVLLSQAVVDRLNDRRRTESLGPQRIRGFADPVPVSRLVPVG